VSIQCERMASQRRMAKGGGGRRTAKGDVIEVLGRGDGLDLSSDVELLDRVAKVGNGGVSDVVGSEDVDGLGDLVGLVDVRDCNEVDR
jgi:hypothetical protein